jgi:hypothetical protein
MAFKHLLLNNITGVAADAWAAAEAVVEQMVVVVGWRRAGGEGGERCRVEAATVAAMADGAAEMAATAVEAAASKTKVAK